MSTQKPLVNRVAASSLITINLEDLYPKGEVLELDLKNYLFKELILKEKDFRDAMKSIEWSEYEDKHLCVYCSTDAIIPVWAFMLVAVYAQPHAKSLHFGSRTSFLEAFYDRQIQALDATVYEGKKLVIKGCSNKPVPTSAYFELTAKLRPHAQSIMYGEPCSTVPLYKQARKNI